MSDGLISGDEQLPADDELASSWLRSANQHHVDPESRAAPGIITNSKLNELREPLAKLIADARTDIDRLYSVVQRANYTVLLCNDEGVAIDHRGNEAQADQFKHWGTWLGGVWSEEVEGTNGIGTCIVDERPVSVHRCEHFRVRHTSLSCSGAPLFDNHGKLIGVLDVSSIDPQLSEASHALTGALTEAAARAIEERCFRESFRREWIIAAGALDSGAGMLLAVDSGHQIIGADRYARTMLTRNGLRIEDGVSIWAVLEWKPELFRNKDQGDFATVLVFAGGLPRPAILTPPETSWQKPESSRLHTRPRLSDIGSVNLIDHVPLIRGGLSPSAVRRVKDYIDANLEQRIDLAALAQVAGLSVFHFARAFKQSEGVTPHTYLLERRIEHAHHLLADSDLSILQIATATGFSDQAHLARQYRRRLGVTPGAFRRSIA